MGATIVFGLFFSFSSLLGFAAFFYLFRGGGRRRASTIQDARIVNCRGRQWCQTVCLVLHWTNDKGSMFPKARNYNRDNIKNEKRVKLMTGDGVPHKTIETDKFTAVKS